jgi:hypothetical protein
VTVSPQIENNVAVSRPAGLGVSSATWYGPDGQVIASLSVSGQQAAAQARALAVSERRPIAAALIKHLAIFRRPVPPPATIKPLPHRTAAKLALNHGYGLNVAEARFVPYPGTPGVWLVPGSKGISMLNLTSRGGSGGDAPVAMVLSGAMIGADFGPHRETISGVVPDVNPTVTLVLAGGARRTVSVIDNVYSVGLTPQAVAVIAKDAAGHTVTNRAP